MIFKTFEKSCLKLKKKHFSHILESPHSLNVCEICWRNFVRKLENINLQCLVLILNSKKTFLLSTSWALSIKCLCQSLYSGSSTWISMHVLKDQPKIRQKVLLNLSHGLYLCSFCYLFSRWGVGLFAKIGQNWQFREFYFEFSRVIASLVFLFSYGSFFQKFQQSCIKVTCLFLVRFSYAVPRFALLPGQHDDIRLESASLTANDGRQRCGGDHDCLRSAQDCVPHNHNWNVGN